ncbi:MAG: hypothetical protein JNJ69_07785 [Leptospiraceae bacterium]|nr:hypothetical protein [Leptospiraceae bacterium]
MRKALGSLLALVVSALIISTIISFFTRDSFESLPVKGASAPVKLTRRMQETMFSVSTEYVSRYDYNWLTEKLHVLRDPAGRRLLPVPVNFYLSNNLSFAEYPLAAMDVIDSDCNVRSEKIVTTRRYLKSLQVANSEGKKTGLHVASYRALGENVTLHYTDASPRAAKCLAAQVMALGEISFLQDSASLVLPAFQALRVNLAPYERAELIDRAGRNIYTAIAEAYKKNPAHKVRVLITNTVPYMQAQSLPFAELAGQFVGLTAEELTAMKNAALASNGAAGVVPDLGKRIEIGIDTAVIWQLWQTAKIPYYKDASGEPMLYEDMILALRRSLTDSDAAGVLQNRKLKAIYASYARDNDEKKKWGESINLPYQRASAERLMKLQVQMLLDIYDFSAVGLEGETFIALEMPARQKFPVLHMTVRPLARKLGFEEKKDGSDISEIEKSLLLVRSTLAQAGK